jgi:hypothetical protein
MKRLQLFGALVLGLLRELSDESAYRRYLASQGCHHSGEEWRRFCEKRFGAKYQRPKCC